MGRCAANVASVKVPSAPASRRARRGPRVRRGSPQRPGDDQAPVLSCRDDHHRPDFRLSREHGGQENVALTAPHGQRVGARVDKRIGPCPPVRKNRASRRSFGNRRITTHWTPYPRPAMISGYALRRRLMLSSPTGSFPSATSAMRLQTGQRPWCSFGDVARIARQPGMSR